MTSSETGEVVVVTGMSGAGRSTALRALEDVGFYCVDNLPTPLVGTTVETCEMAGIERLALGIDVRVRQFLDQVEPTLESISQGGRAVRILFLDASTEALLRRYSSSRRPHPLAAVDETASGTLARAVVDAIEFERTQLALLRSRAEVLIDTTRLSVHDLRRQVLHKFGVSAHARRMRVRVLSFGFKFGVPIDADLSFDVRFIDNPFFVDELRDLSGETKEVSDYVLSREGVDEFFERTVGLLAYLLPLYEKEGKSYLTIAIGCTGGRHRSVALARAIQASLSDKLDLQMDLVHRDVREADPKP